MDSAIGCEHYKRTCIFVTPCCKKTYTCRICHDAAEDHTLNRKAIAKLKCALCTSVQPVAAKCRTCSVPFARYVCLKCNLFDNNQKGQFHCDSCGICRVGGRENFFHCSVCNFCLNQRLRYNHKCVENASHNSCPICLEDIHNSTSELVVPKCGHLLHKKCNEQLEKANMKECTICKKPLTLYLQPRSF